MLEPSQERIKFGDLDMQGGLIKFAFLAVGICIVYKNRTTLKSLTRTIKNRFNWYSVQEKIKLRVLLLILQQFIRISYAAYLQRLCGFHRANLRLHFLVALLGERVQEEGQVAEEDQEHRQRADQQADA